MTTTDEILASSRMTTLDGLKRCIDELSAHARELEKMLAAIRKKGCAHEWFERRCVHCGISSAEFNSFSRITRNTLDSEHY